MRTKINPFRPTLPIGCSMFAGRHNEISKLIQGIHQTSNGNPRNFTITGKRGIGKSSLIKYVNAGAMGRLDDKRFTGLNFLTITNILKKSSTTSSLVDLFCSNLEDELIVIEPVRGYWNRFWSFFQRVKVMDSGIEEAKIETDKIKIINEFAEELATISQRIGNKGRKSKSGILVILDEASEASEELGIGFFYKALTESLDTKECNNVSFVLIGLPSLLKKISESNKSATRVFHNIELKPLSHKESKLVIIKGMKSANFGNGNPSPTITMKDDVLEKICSMANGDPHKLQKLAASAFDKDTDYKITLKDLEECEEYQNY